MQMETKRNLDKQYSSDKINFKIKTAMRDKEGHYIMIKGLVQQQDKAIVNMHPTREYLKNSDKC